MPTVLVNPLDERIHQHAKPAPRLDTLKGKSLALLDISKPGGSVFFDRLETLLTERYGVASILRVAKPTFAKPAPGDVLAKIRDAQVHAAIEALAD